MNSGSTLGLVARRRRSMRCSTPRISGASPIAFGCRFPGRQRLCRRDMVTQRVFSVLDSGGTIITVLQTHGYVFGSGIVAPETGVLLNNQMLGFNPIPGTATSAAPGQTRPIPGWPVVGYRSSDGALFGISVSGAAIERSQQ